MHIWLSYSARWYLSQKASNSDLPIGLTCKMETETVNFGSSSRVIGSKRVSFSALVSAYSFSPEWRLISEKVPMQPRKRWSRPIFHVTKSGLERDFLWFLATVVAWTTMRFKVERYSQCMIGNAQVAGLHMTITAMQLLVQDVEAKERHFGHHNLAVISRLEMHASILIRVSVVLAMVSLLRLLLLLRMSVLEREKLPACHRWMSFKLRTGKLI